MLYPRSGTPSSQAPRARRPASSFRSLLAEALREEAPAERCQPGAARASQSATPHRYVLHLQSELRSVSGRLDSVGAAQLLQSVLAGASQPALLRAA